MKSREMASLVEDYSSRIGHYMAFEVESARSEDKVKLERDDFLIVCDERGKEMSSVEMSELLKKHQMIGTKRLVFFIGDAKGVGPYMKERAKAFLSLSKMTFPHELARVVMLEQLYRACTIMRGEKYHYE